MALQKQVSWSVFKAFVDDKGLSIQYLDFGREYSLQAYDGFFSLECVLDRSPTDSTDLDDFETNYKLKGNKSIGQKPFADAYGFRARFKGISGTATKNTTTNIDHKLTEERYIDGVQLILKNQTIDDYVKFQVVDVDNVVGYGAGAILDEFGSTWNVVEDKQEQGIVRVAYPAKILANLYIRVVYVSAGTELDVKVKANLFLHKKT